MTNEMKEILDELSKIDERRSAIAEEVETADASVLEERDQESKELETRKAELLARKEELEAEEREAEEVANGNVETEDVELPTEERANTMENKVFGIDSEEYRNAWSKNLLGRKMTEAEERAYATSDAANAVPEAVSTKFFEKMKKLAPMISEITLFRAAGNLKFMTEGTRTSADIHVQNTSIDIAADTVLNVSLGGEEFVKAISLSQATLVMSISQFEDWLVEMLAGDIARAIDNYIINGTTNGIVNMVSTATTNKVTQTATSGYGYKDLVKLVGLLPAAYDPEAKFLVNKSVLWNDIMGICDNNNRPIFDPVEKKLLGYDVIIDDYVPTNKKQVYLGKFTDVVGNLSQDVKVDKSSESGFLRNATDYRGSAIFDSKLAKTDAIVWLANA
jgi:HK97 family phage major capsid protein